MGFQLERGAGARAPVLATEEAPSRAARIYLGISP